MKTTITHFQRYVIHYYFPIVTVFQFICLMGWLKVAEALLNPLGEDDDDFEVNFLIDSNIYVGEMSVSNRSIIIRL